MQKALTGCVVIGLVVVALISALTPPAVASGERPEPSVSGRAPRWPAPPPDRVVELATAAGLVPETAERLGTTCTRTSTSSSTAGTRRCRRVSGSSRPIPPSTGHHQRSTRLRRNHRPVRAAVHLTPAHPRRHRHPSHRVRDPGQQHAGSVLHRVGRPAHSTVCWRVLHAGHAHRHLRQRPPAALCRCRRDLTEQSQGDHARHRTPPVAHPADRRLLSGLTGAEVNTATAFVATPTIRTNQPAYDPRRGPAAAARAVPRS